MSHAEALALTLFISTSLIRQFNREMLRQPQCLRGRRGFKSITGLVSRGVVANKSAKLLAG